MKSPAWQRVPASAMRIDDPGGEARAALLYALLAIAMSGVTGLLERAWRAPLWGSTYLTSDAWYVFGFKIGFMLLLPLWALRRRGYRAADFLAGWRLTPGSLLVVVMSLALGVFVNAGKWDSVRAAAATFPPAEALVRVAVGGVIVLFTAGIPEELVYRGFLQTRLERIVGRPAAILVTAILFTAWHLPSRFMMASGAEGAAGDLASVIRGTGLPVLVVGLILGLAWDRWRNLPALIALHWGIDALPSICSFLGLAP